MAVSLLALFIALSGIAQAASIPRNSVGAAQPKDGAVPSTKLGTGAVTARAIRIQNVSLKAIGTQAVGQRALADEAVNGAKIAPKAVGRSDLADQAVGTRALASRSVNAAELNLPYTSVTKLSAVIPSGKSGYRNVRATCAKNHRAVGGDWVGPTTTDPLKSAAVITGNRPYPPSSSAPNAWEIYGNDAAPERGA